MQAESLSKSRHTLTTSYTELYCWAIRCSHQYQFVVKNCIMRPQTLIFGEVYVVIVLMLEETPSLHERKHLLNKNVLLDLLTHFKKYVDIAQVHHVYH